MLSNPTKAGPLLREEMTVGASSYLNLSKLEKSTTLRNQRIHLTIKTNKLMPRNRERRQHQINSSSKLDNPRPQKQLIQSSPLRRLAVRRRPPSRSPNLPPQSLQLQQRAPEEAIITFSTVEKSGSIWPTQSTRCCESVRWRWSGRLSLLRRETMQIIRVPQLTTKAQRKTQATKITSWLSPNKQRKTTWTGMLTLTLFGTMWPSSLKNSAS